MHATPRRQIVRLLAIGTVIAAGITTRGAWAAPGEGTPDEAKAMAEKAAVLLKADGFDKATVAFGAADGPFRDRDLYVYIWNTDGKCLFNAGTPSLVGKTLIDMKDVDGTPIIRNLIAVQDKGWISYNWPNPNTHARAAPPLRPRLAAPASFPSSTASGTAPVAMSTMSFPSWIGSRGRGVRLVGIVVVLAASNIVSEHLNGRNRR